MNSSKDVSLIAQERKAFHRRLFDAGVLSLSSNSKSEGGYIASNGDTGQKFSATVSQRLAEKIATNMGTTVPKVDKKQDGQRLGSQFEEISCDFIKNCFLSLNHLRPGKWIIEKVSGRSESMVSRFAQYSHLAELKELAEKYDDLATFLGHGYTISPDVIIGREPEPDEVINASQLLVDDNYAIRSALRASTQVDKPLTILHASISCKFTMRSDRAQNTRTEALNLIRNRKGRSPHIVAVTAEPTPSRLGSLALGTGDIDCVYHFALDELQQVFEELGYDDALDALNVMIKGQRLKDISDLPLDLVV